MPQRILIAPDKFKGTLTSAQAARASPRFRPIRPASAAIADASTIRSISTCWNDSRRRPAPSAESSRAAAERSRPARSRATANTGWTRKCRPVPLRLRASRIESTRNGMSSPTISTIVCAEV